MELLRFLTIIIDALKFKVLKSNSIRSETIYIGCEMQFAQPNLVKYLIFEA